MIKKIGKLLAFTGMLGLASPTWALFLSDGTDVGGADRENGRTVLNDTSITAEEDWAQATLGIDLDFAFRIESTLQTQIPWESTFVDPNFLDRPFTNVFATGGIQSADYFMIYVTGETTALGYDHVLYQNIDHLDYALIDTGPNPFGIALGDLDRIFHISLFNEAAVIPDPSPVPEPSSLALLSIGLLGVGFARRRKQK